MPIYEGFPLYHALNKARVGGRDITDIFRAGVEENKIAIKGGDIHTLRQIIEKTCSVPIEFDYNYYLDENNQDIIKKETQLFKLPDETIVSISRKTRVLASELLFNPKVWENTKNELGLIDLITGSIKKTEMFDKNFKESLVENIVLSGGTSMMENFPQRVENDLKGYKEEDGFELEYEPIVDAAINRNIGKWIGMGMISRMSAFDKLFIKKQDYQELGEERLSELSQIF